MNLPDNNLLVRMNRLLAPDDDADLSMPEWDDDDLRDEVRAMIDAQED